MRQKPLRTARLLRRLRLRRLRVLLPDLHWHDLRHTFATRWLRDRGPIARLQQVLGHSTITQTMRYAHLVTEDLHEAQRAIDAVRQKRKVVALPEPAPKPKRGRTRNVLLATADSSSTAADGDRNRTQSAKKLDTIRTLAAAK